MAVLQPPHNLGQIIPAASDSDVAERDAIIRADNPSVGQSGAPESRAPGNHRCCLAKEYSAVHISCRFAHGRPLLIKLQKCRGVVPSPCSGYRSTHLAAGIHDIVLEKKRYTASLSEHGGFRKIALSVDMFLFPNPFAECSIVSGLLERPKINFILKDIKK